MFAPLLSQSAGLSIATALPLESLVQIAPPQTAPLKIQPFFL